MDPKNSLVIVIHKFIYLFRRALVIGLLFVRLSTNSLIPLMILLYIQIAYTMFLAFTRPYKKKFDNRLELFNETLAMYMLFCMQVLNDPSKKVD